MGRGALPPSWRLRAPPRAGSGLLSFLTTKNRNASMMLNMPSRLRHAVAAIVCTVLAAGCSTTKHPPAPLQVDNSAYTYIIGPGDSVNIIVWRNPELSMSVPVRPDGKVAAPLVDEVMAQGKTSVQLARDIEKVLGTYVRDPVVTVMVSGFVGPYSEQIRVVGAATRPQALPYKNKMTLLDVMIAVGGLTDFADGNAATIQRGAE